ncbi:hypothetical protein VOLCADRAFT_95059 [Volvox carteri f. nagariensis]|uniref:Uncharacterized protein n=1 Tax=Volvox carteri f. nagariensis TaxID=3068 RepID=D8U6H3_VOLCA|nr:uncharacterized protein VOLCADRAFT_95059 [Volvox carteri f. nagariensis]EFJ44648.1 hypothetical protein VOLCADRAFT_95059 [Volvox carteri f. nagariensis]|eukprot:XP_002954224.1 hypothetical protein VOLCADRAFT_95059 [Volvox carteri f. nagariensis]
MAVFLGELEGRLTFPKGEAGGSMIDHFCRFSQCSPSCLSDASGDASVFEISRYRDHAALFTDGSQVMHARNGVITDLSNGTCDSTESVEYLRDAGLRVCKRGMSPTVVCAPFLGEAVELQFGLLCLVHFVGDDGLCLGECSDDARSVV